MKCALVLVAAFAACSATLTAAAGPFANEGSPPFFGGYSVLSDPATGEFNGVGVEVNGSYSYTSGNTADGLLTDVGTYTSWECGSEPGSYVAAYSSTQTLPNGTVVTGEFCEFGMIYPPSVVLWASGVECPNSTTGTSMYLQPMSDGEVCGTAAPNPVATAAASSLCTSN